MDGGFIGFVAEVQDCIVSWCNAFRLGIFFTGGVAAHGEALGAEAVEEELGLHVYSCQDHMGGVICCVLAPVDAGTGLVRITILFSLPFSSMGMERCMHSWI